MNWLDDPERWHDLGHVLFGYFLASAVGLFTLPVIGLGAAAVYGMGKEYLDMVSWEGSTWKDSLGDWLQYLFGGFVAMALLILHRII